MRFLKSLTGKRSQILGVLLSALGTILAVDILLHESPTWLTIEQYGAASALFGGPMALTMAAKGNRIEKATKNKNASP